MASLIGICTAVEAFGAIYFWGTALGWFALAAVVAGAVMLILFACAEIWGE